MIHTIIFTEELRIVQDKLSKVRNDVESKYRAELEEVKDKYNEKVTDMLQHIRNLDTELVEKGLLLNKMIR